VAGQSDFVAESANDAGPLPTEGFCACIYFNVLSALASIDQL
jgi:hypothetical protein